jgi:hypothetical protein
LRWFIRAISRKREIDRFPFPSGNSAFRVQSIRKNSSGILRINKKSQCDLNSAAASREGTRRSGAVQNLRVLQNIGKQGSAKVIEFIPSLTLVHPEKKLEVPTVQAVTKHNLSRSNTAPSNIN